MGLKKNNLTLQNLDNEKFLVQVKTNWKHWEKDTTIRSLAQYMFDKGFSSQAFGTLSKMSKPELVKIILKGEEKAKEEIQETRDANKFVSGLINGLNDFKIEVRGSSLNPFIKKRLTVSLAKHAEKIQDESIYEKLGIVADVMTLLLLIADFVFKNGIHAVIPLITKFGKKLFKMKEKEDKKETTLEAKEKVKDDKNK